MKKYFLFVILNSYLASSLVYADSIQKILFSNLPTAVQTTTLKRFKLENIDAVTLIKDNKGKRYKVTGDLDGILQTIQLEGNGTVISIQQKWSPDQEINCEDVSSPAQDDPQAYYFQVEGLIQANPIKRCRPGK